MIATVNVRLYYQPHCPECMKQVEETISSAIRDQSVAGVSMVAANKCEHDALAAPRLTVAAKSKPTPTPPGGSAALPGQLAMPMADLSGDAPNGFDAGVN